MREVAQGSPGQAALLRRSHALSEGGRGLEGDDPADGGDRQGHTGLAYRVAATTLRCRYIKIAEIGASQDNRLETLEELSSTATYSQKF